MTATYEELLWIVDDYVRSYEESLHLISSQIDSEAIGIVISKFNELKLILNELNKFPFQHDMRLKSLKDRVKKLDRHFIKIVSGNSEGYLNALEHDLIRLLNRYETLMKYLLKNDAETHLQLLEIRDRIQFELHEIKGKRDVARLEERLEAVDRVLKTSARDVLKKYGEAALPFPLPERFWWRRLS